MSPFLFSFLRPCVSDQEEQIRSSQGEAAWRNSFLEAQQQHPAPNVESDSRISSQTSEEATTNDHESQQYQPVPNEESTETNNLESVTIVKSELRIGLQSSEEAETNDLETHQHQPVINEESDSRIENDNGFKYLKNDPRRSWWARWFCCGPDKEKDFLEEAFILHKFMKVVQRDAAVLSHEQHFRDFLLANINESSIKYKVGDILRYAPDDLLDDKAFMTQACTINGTVLRHASTNLRSDKDVVIVAASTSPESLKYAMGGLNQDPDCLVAAGIWVPGYLSSQHDSSDHNDFVSEDEEGDADDVGGDGCGSGDAATRQDEPVKTLMMNLSSQSDSSDNNDYISEDKEGDADDVGGGSSDAATGQDEPIEIQVMNLSSQSDSCDNNDYVSEDEEGGVDDAVVDGCGSGDTATEQNEPIETPGVDADFPGVDSTTSTTEAVMPTTESEDSAEKLIVLSTKFSLAHESPIHATLFASMLNSDPFIREGGFRVYSPNAYAKDTCDPEWTRMEWPCRGTYNTCQKERPFKTGKPQPGSCWRYSFRYQLEQAKRTKGFMIQVVDLKDASFCSRHELGKGQQIETVMADEVGTKVFRFHEPAVTVGCFMYTVVCPSDEHRESVRKENLERLLVKVKAWYEGECRDMRLTTTSLCWGMKERAVFVSAIIFVILINILKAWNRNRNYS